MAIPRGVSRRVQVQLTTTALAAYTGAAPTVVVTKDGGAQVAATNAATHKGGGQWELVLTAAEMTADEVTAQFTAATVVPVVVSLYPEADLTPARAAKLDNVDAAITSRATPADVAASTTTITETTTGAVNPPTRRRVAE